MRAIADFLGLLVRCIGVYLLAWTGCLRLAKRRLRDRGALVTLTFHRVLDDNSYQTTNSLPGIVIRERTFREVVRYVAERCEPVALADGAPDAPCGTIRIAVTLDDGWLDNYTTAFPILSDYRMPATIFVCPGLLGKTVPFWPERASALVRAARPDTTPDQLSDLIESLKRRSPEQREQYLNELAEQARNGGFTIKTSAVDTTLSWDEIIEMGRAGFCFGSHTNTHQILTTVPASLSRQELQHSKAMLERVLEKPCHVFAYPNGNWSPETRQIVEETGFTRAVTTERGVLTSASDPLAIPRSNVCEASVVGITGRFWPAMFEYTTMWKAWRAAARSRPVPERSGSAKQAAKPEPEALDLADLSKTP